MSDVAGLEAQGRIAWRANDQQSLGGTEVLTELGVDRGGLHVEPRVAGEYQLPLRWQRSQERVLFALRFDRWFDGAN